MSIADNEWVFITELGNEWQSDSFYINPEQGAAKIVRYEVTYWSHHDESESEERELTTTIENVIASAYPDEDALSRIQTCTGHRYKEMIESYEETHRVKEFQNSGIRDLAITVPAFYLSAQGDEQQGILKKYYDRFAFYGHSGSSEELLLHDKLNLDPRFYPFKIDGAGTTLTLVNPEKHSYRFWMTRSDCNRFRSEYLEPYNRYSDQILAYKNSILDDWLDRKISPWPGITHPFKRKHHPIRTEIKDMFSLMLEGCDVLRPFVLERLPWKTELITIKNTKDSLSVFYQSDQSGKFAYRETEDAIEIEHLDVSGSETERCALTFIPNNVDQLTSPESIRTTDNKKGARSLKLQDPFGMSGCFQVERLNSTSESMRANGLLSRFFASQ